MINVKIGYRAVNIKLNRPTPRVIYNRYDDI